MQGTGWPLGTLTKKTELGFLGHLALAGVKVLGTHLKPSKNSSGQKEKERARADGGCFKHGGYRVDGWELSPKEFSM